MNSNGGPCLRLQDALLERLKSQRGQTNARCAIADTLIFPIKTTHKNKEIAYPADLRAAVLFPKNHMVMNDLL